MPAELRLDPPRREACMRDNAGCRFLPPVERDTRFGVQARGRSRAASRVLRVNERRNPTVPLPVTRTGNGTVGGSNVQM